MFTLDLFPGRELREQVDKGVVSRPHHPDVPGVFAPSGANREGKRFRTKERLWYLDTTLFQNDKAVGVISRFGPGGKNSPYFIQKRAERSGFRQRVNTKRFLDGNGSGTFLRQGGRDFNGSHFSLAAFRRVCRCDFDDQLSPGFNAGSGFQNHGMGRNERHGSSPGDGYGSKGRNDG